jgi:hypothetical protein
VTAAITAVKFPTGQIVHLGVPGEYHPNCGVTSSAQPKNALERAYAKVTCDWCEVLPPERIDRDPQLESLFKELGV